jgi:hypothetical protein
VALHFVQAALSQWFTANVFRDSNMSQDFRMAMSRLCFDPMLTTGQAEGTVVESILAWITGDLRLLSAVRKAQIYEKIARHNARDLFLSTAHWARSAGYAGLAVLVDATAISVRSHAMAEGSLFYTRAAVMDFYELLRQFIDATDEMDGLFFMVSGSSDLLTDEQRGIDIYTALKLRVSDEVRNLSVDNPLSTLVRLRDDL